MTKSNNIHRLLLLMIFWGNITIGFAQNIITKSAVTAIYKITNDEAERIYQTSYASIAYDGYYHTLIDTFSTRRHLHKLNLKGHYLFVKAVEDRLLVDLKSFHTISATPLNNRRDLMIQVIDSLGNPIKNAEVFFENEKIKYDPSSLAFRKKKVNQGGFLKIRAHGETVFYQVNDRNNDSVLKKRYHRFKNTKVGWVINTPVRWGHRVWFFFKSGIIHRWWPWHIFSRRKKDKSHRGYIVFNQPKYQPGDTVKVKAYLTNHRGKPLNRKLQLKLSQSYIKHISTVSVSPTSKGNYYYEFVLGDSLRLDQRYWVEFFLKKNKRKKEIMSHYFYYEDYQLDEVDYTFEATKEEYGIKEKIILLAEGKDKNNWTIPDGQVEITALAGSIDEYYEEKVIVRDTLWKLSQALDTRGQTQFIIPKENLPNAKLKIMLQANFSNSNGELDTKTTTIQYDAKEESTEEIKVTLEDEFVVAKYFVDGKEQTAEADLWLEGDENNIDANLKVSLPFKERVNPFVMDYDFAAGDAYHYISLEDDENQANIVGFGKQTKDSIFIHFVNPRRVPITFQVRNKNKLIVNNQTDEKNFQYALKRKNKKAIFLYFQYVWGGQSFEEKIPIHFYKKLLSIDVEQPESITPGANAQFKISVKTAKDKPAKKVNLTAGAINAQFNNLNNLKEPQINYKDSKSPFEYDTFELESKNIQNRWKTISTKCYDDLGLDSSLYYRILLPKNGVHMESFPVNSPDSFYQNVAQFAPYLVKDGRMQPIHLIYCNRKLVYYSNVSNVAPYSFVGREGYNTITIRTRKALYTIDNIWLEKGKKLEFSIDVDNYSKSDFSKNIYRGDTQPNATPVECDLLNRQIFIFRNQFPGKKIYLWQDSTNIQSFQLPLKKNDKFMIGPFHANNNLRLLVQDGWENNFFFEPGFVYEIAENRERLYQHDYFKHPNKKGFYRRKKRVGELVFSPNQIQPESPSYDRLPRTFLKSVYGKKGSDTGNFVFKYSNQQKNDSSIYAIALIDQDSHTFVFTPTVRKFSHLPAGAYTLIFFTPHGNYFKKELDIKASETLFLNLNNNSFTIDTTKVLFEKTMLEHSKKKWNQDKLNALSKNHNQVPTFPIYNFIGGISGTITDIDGETLIGANIQVKGTNVGTTSDIDGTYTIQIPDGYNELVFSYTGYTTKEVTIGSSNNHIINVTLNEGVELSEVVVTGLGISRRIKIRGYASSSDIASLPSKNINALQGKVAGVSSTQDNYFDLSVKDISEIKSRPNLDLASLNKVDLRSNFSDYAYFQPNLITDKNGEAYFNVTFPDDITAWKTYVVGMDKKLRAGTKIAEIKSFKNLTAQLAIPRFLVEGDEATIIGKSVNYTLDSFQVTTAFKMGDTILKTNQINLHEALIEKTKITAPQNRDSLSLSYLLATDNHGDGEKRDIPIFPKGVKQTNGEFVILDKAKSFNTSFSPEWGEVTLRIEDNVLNNLLDDVKYLRNYPYGCNEQTASRLIALLLEEDIKKHLGEKFDGKKEIIKMIRRLKKTQNPNGSWGWWKNGNQNIWMTTYVLKALKKAKDANYKTRALNKGLLFLTGYLNEMKGKDLLNALALFSEVGQNLDYKKYIAQLDSTQHGLFDQFSLIKIRQAQGLPYSINSIMQHKRETLFAGWHFGEDNYHWYNNSIKITLLAYDIFKNMPADSSEIKREDAMSNIRQYFFSRRKSKYGWRNTIVTAQILSAILPDIMDSKNGLPKNGVKISGMLNQTIAKFPFETKINITDLQSLHLEKLGETPLFITAYQEFWNKHPKKKSDIFNIKTYLIQEGKRTQDLKAAVAADLKVEVEVKKSSEYVMIEIPIPAGCSYREKPNNYWNQESHREYFKNRVAIFCEKLPRGNYSFTIPLEPRFSGKFILNPTKAEQMYFPVFYGRNGLGVVEIK